MRYTVEIASIVWEIGRSFRGKQMEKSVLKQDLTPYHLRCGTGSCPAVFALSDGNLLIIGKRPSQALAKQVEGKIAADEFAVILSPEYLINLCVSVE
jgi:hypothetical protein